MSNKRKRSDRTALLIYCTRDQADQIRVAAKQEQRTISGFIVSAVMKRLEARARVQEALLVAKASPI